jgi:predicted PhzF superfamily epimerase YddE/YHI9
VDRHRLGPARDPLASFDAVRRAAPTADALAKHASSGNRAMAYVFAREGDHVLCRFFFLKHTSVIEDPAPARPARTWAAGCW